MSGAEKTVMGVCFDAEKDQTKMIGYGWLGTIITYLFLSLKLGLWNIPSDSLRQPVTLPCHG
jgi:hypothetical protein